MKAYIYDRDVFYSPVREMESGDVTKCYTGKLVFSRGSNKMYTAGFRGTQMTPSPPQTLTKILNFHREFSNKVAVKIQRP